MVAVLRLRGGGSHEMAAKNEEAYGRVKGGALKLKGSTEAIGGKMKKKKKKKKDKNGDDEDIVVDEDPQQCAGQILSNTTTVMGKETIFREVMENGDVLLIMHPNTLAYETRTIKAVLSNVSILIDEPFSSDLISYTDFQFIRNPHARKAAHKDKTDKDKAAKKLKIKESRTFKYRVKKPGVAGTWVEHSETIQSECDASTLLDMRMKHAHDRHC